MITKQIKQQPHMVMTALITILLAVFGSVQNAVGEVTLKPSGTEWDNTTNWVKPDGKFITVNVTNPGDFAKYINKKDCDFLTTYGSTTTFIYTGKANSDDLAALSKLTNKQINLSKLVLDDTKLKTPEDVINAIKLNPNAAEYLALPDADAELTKSDDPPLKSLCDTYTNLKGVAYYYKNGESFTCYSSKPGEVYILTFMSFSETWDDGKTYNKGNTGTFPLSYLIISGNLNAKDVSANGSAKYDNDGHFALVSDAENVIGGTTKFADKGTEGSEDAAFIGCYSGVKKLDLSDAKFTNPADLTLSMTNLITTNTTTVLIPTDESVTVLPPDFLRVDNSSLKEICIPRNIEKIGARAFYLMTGLNHVTTTDAKGKVVKFDYGKKVEKKTINTDDGSWTDHVIDSTQTDENSGTVVFSDNLKEIDSYAFNTMTHVKDVYVLAPKAPACHVNAFSTIMYTGNNGFDPAGSITRLDYQNQGYWITMLHYPNQVKGTDEEKRYTDVTRDYTITDADGNTDGWGNVIHWPNQTEFTRAYEQGTTGYLWRAWDTSREPWSQYGSCALNTSNHKYEITQGEANQFYRANTAEDRASSIFYHTESDKDPEESDVDDGNYTKVKNTDGKQLYDRDYRGWHQFSLAESYDYENTIPSHNFSYINDNNWWTICVPFDMTKKEVKDMFGTDGTHGGPHVCEFTGVTREANADGQGNGKIVLRFDRDVYNWIYKADGKKIKTTDDNIVIHKGKPYLLRPDYKEEVDGKVVFTPSQHILRDPKCKAVSSVDLRKMAMDSVVEVTAKDAHGYEDTNYKYTFVGNFWQTEMPGFAYFLAWCQTADYPKGFATFYWQAEQPEGTQNWNPYTAIIGCNWSDREFYIPNTKTTDNTDNKPTLANVHWVTRIGNVQSGLSVFNDDSFKNSNGAGAKANSPENVSIEAAGNTADGITKVHFGDRTIDIFHGKVYNLNGQYVGDSLEGLPKGIYIAAGKKYVVK